MPCVISILETCLHVDNVETSARFYEKVFKFREVDSDQPFCALEVTACSYCSCGTETQAPVTTPGGVTPPHFGIWEEHVTRSGITIESRVIWPREGASLYFRDPDRHFVELATPGIWPSY